MITPTHSPTERSQFFCDFFPFHQRISINTHSASLHIFVAKFYSKTSVYFINHQSSKEIHILHHIFLFSFYIFSLFIWDTSFSSSDGCIGSRKCFFIYIFWNGTWSICHFFLSSVWSLLYIYSIVYLLLSSCTKISSIALLIRRQY